MDSALLSPHEQEHSLGTCEDAYSQSVGLGNRAWPAAKAPSSLEQAFLGAAREAEAEWNPLDRESAQVTSALRFLRQLCSSTAKRSIGVRLGFHAAYEHLAAFETTIRNADALSELTE